MAISLEIVSPRGITRQETGLDRIVVRRREADFHPGSEVAICPHHGRLLMQTEACEMRLSRGGAVATVEAGAGVLEVIDDRVTLVLTG